MKICLICKEDDLVTVQINKCQHNVCYECLCQHLTQFNSALILCPVKDCKSKISDYIIRKCLSNDKLNYYDSLCYASNTVKCLIKDCFYYISYDEKEGHFTCPVCRQPNCVTCGKLHDINYRCPDDADYNPKPFIKEAKKYLQEERKKHISRVSDNDDLIPNYEEFECPTCDNFILPREGYLLRNCSHTFCRTCLTANYVKAEHIKNFKCGICSEKLTDREIHAFIGQTKAQDLSLSIIKPKLFSCQTPECKGMWDFTTFTGKHPCPVCNVINCGDCKDIHGDMSCEEFRLTTRYLDAQSCLQRMIATQHINCESCNTTIIKNKGCNALRCPNCKLQVCAFSGKEIGPKGCKCTKKNRCHPTCSPGCIPDGDSRYEKEMKKFFYDN